jgi:hypothetical protein
MPLVTITGLKTTAGADLATNPSINTDIVFSITESNAVPMTCSAIKSAASSSTTADSFLSIYSLSGSSTLKTKLTNLKSGLAFADQGQELTGKTGFDTDTTVLNIQNYIFYIKDYILPVIKLVDICLQESLEVDTSALTEAQEALNESKSRYESITNPERNVSYYEGWFPMVRPMSEPALFGLFGAAIFMLLVSILIFLRLSGVQIDIQIPESTFALPPNASYYMYGGAVVGIIGAVAYGYMRKN